jgi:hypothetical protein
MGNPNCVHVPPRRTPNEPGQASRNRWSRVHVPIIQHISNSYCWPAYGDTLRPGAATASRAAGSPRAGPAPAGTGSSLAMTGEPRGGGGGRIDRIGFSWQCRVNIFNIFPLTKLSSAILLFL